MNTKNSSRNADTSSRSLAGEIWSRLHAEREDLCARILAEPLPMKEAKLTKAQEACPVKREAEWGRKEALRVRLRRIDDALDRLMAGAYGFCSRCGVPIEEKRLADDPAISQCAVCQSAQVTEQRRSTAINVSPQRVVQSS